MRRVLLVASLLLVPLLAGCVLQEGGGDARTGDLVRIVTFDLDGDLDEANDPQDVVAALADTRFEYTHSEDAVQAADVMVAFTDESGRAREAALSDFTGLATVARGDKITIGGALMTSPIELRRGDDVLAARGGPERDWLAAGGYPLPLLVRGGLAEWDLKGGIELDAGFDRLEVTDSYENYCWEEPCEPATITETTRATDASLVGDADLTGTLRLASDGLGLEPALELGIDGVWTIDALGNVHVLESSNEPEDEGTDADFGFDLDLRLAGDGLVRLRFDREGNLFAAGREGSVSASGRFVAWDDEHPRSEAYEPEDIDAIDEQVAYEEQDLPLGDNPSSPIADLLRDLWGMDLAAGDEFRFDTGDRFGGDGPRGTLTIRVVSEGDKSVDAGTFEAWRVETTAAIVVPYDGGSQTFELPMLTTWIDTDSGVPIAVEQTYAYDYDEQDFAPLFELMRDDGMQVQAPADLHIRLEGRPVAELSEWDEGIRIAPMAGVLFPMTLVAGPLFAYAVPYGFFPFWAMGDDWDESSPEMAVPDIAFSSNTAGPGGRITVIKTEAGVMWHELWIDGAGCQPPTEGDVQAGEMVVCTLDDVVRIIHLPSNTLLFETTL